MTDVTVSHDDADRFATVTIDRPDAGNAMSPAVIADLGELIEATAADDAVRSIVVTGADGTFSAGADVDVFAARADDPDAVIDYLDSFSELYARMEGVSVPIIGRVNGPAYGGGYELAMACDVRIASTDAELCPAELRMGIVPPFERLAMELGEGPARELCFTGGVLEAEAVADTGLFSRVVAPDRLDDAVRDIASRIAARSPNAVAQTKRAMIRHRADELARGQAYRHALDEQCVRHPDFAESVAAFREGRDPDYE
ncbi:enoyl-CoA hydratase/isomerase family protein [Natrinema sp. 1APR25-10V2]|uniref:enoyl-CoA hydratase/isomerase family protein n=1 Tax=Natrinema sp. 1APR25-10V2 TaxID=2951081 RepID=UPI002875F554|nr:enoyl-CoA hydratase/isomerase family protein [Natrinema sp. 1APR25-10V2]MDS0477568.1 enoyl-CoA hydratase/isomerase family protein [Natrinema sp. 1APR25-10V2]